MIVPLQFYYYLPASLQTGPNMLQKRFHHHIKQLLRGQTSESNQASTSEQVSNELAKSSTVQSH